MSELQAEQTVPVTETGDVALPADTQVAGTVAEVPQEVHHESLLGLDSYAWVGLAFTAFVLLLWKVGVFSTLGKALDGRAEKVKADLAEAAALKAEAQAMKDRAAVEAAEAEAGAKAMIANAEVEANRIVEQAKVDAETAIARRTKLAEDRIAAEARAVELELRTRAADIAVKAAQSVLQARTADLGGLTDQSIAGLDQR